MDMRILCEVWIPASIQSKSPKRNNLAPSALVISYSKACRASDLGWMWNFLKDQPNKFRQAYSIRENTVHHGFWLSLYLPMLIFSPLI